MTVKGTLLVEGTATEPVVFTGPKEATGGEWCSIAFLPGSGSSVVDHAEVKYGGGNCLGSIYIEGSSPTIKDSTISHSADIGIEIESGGSPEIADDRLVADARYGIHYTAGSGQTGEVNIHGNEIEGGGDGIAVSVTGSGIVGKSLGANTIVGTTEQALVYSGADIPGDITGNTLSGNKSNVVALGGTVSHSETWNDGGVPIRVEGGVTVASGVTLKITQGVFLTQPRMTVKGTLLVEGTATEPVVFTGPKEATGGEWCSIAFLPGS
ncbi:MAG TPA: right-handed parallel beta-helix repeat-containing protein, partial [Solirubrobacterales bacterium]